MEWNVYLSGEIHTDWRKQIEDGITAAGLPVVCTAPVTDHAAAHCYRRTIVAKHKGNSFYLSVVLNLGAGH